MPALDKQYPYDPAKAKQLLAAAGYPNGFDFTMLEQPAIDSGDLLAQAIVADWKAIGVNVTLKSVPSFSAYVTAVETGQYPATTLTFQYSVMLADTQELVTDPALYNSLGYNDVMANQLANDQRKYDVDTPQGVKAAEAAATYMVKNAFLAPVTSTDAVLFSTKSVNVKVGTYPWPDPTQWTPAN